MTQPETAPDLRPPNGYHPADPDEARDPYPALADLRRRCPVSRPERDGFPPLTLFVRYDDITGILRDYRTFGNIGFFPSLAPYRAMPDERRSIIEMDPPRHTAVRRLNLIAMKPAAIDAVVPRIEATARTLVDGFRADGSAELVRRLAVPLPADAIATVLGLPTDDADMIHEWVESTFSEPVGRGEDAGMAKPMSDLDGGFTGYLLGEVRRRREAVDPPDDAITRMLRYRTDDGAAFSDDELVIHIRTLLMAGNETTTSLISNLVYRLLTVPGAYDAVVADRSLVEPLIEECLRYDSPLTQFPRRCFAPTTVAGVALQPDDVVVVSLPSANHDEAVWGDDAGEFRIDRFAGQAPDHLSFGLGVHHCVGSYLARRTARAALHALLDATGDLSLAPDFRYDKVWFFEFWRPKRLDVIFRSR
ncbi:MAG TPA: cytochrome P450 [Acidimicrobiales bacterium]|nr:cytochrome P450 [Acidimicrobiales bacterium]